MSTARRNDLSAHSVEAHSLNVSNHASIESIKVPIGTTITAATSIVPEDSGKTFPVTQKGTTLAITLPATGYAVGCKFKFVITTAAAGNVTLTASGAHLKGYCLQQDDTAANIITSISGTVLTFNGGTNLVNDSVELEVVSSSLILVKAYSGAVGGITAA